MNGSEVDFGPLRAPEQFMVLGLTQPQPGGRSYSPAKQKTLTPRTHVSAGCGEKAISQTLRTSPVGPGLGGRRGPRCLPGCHLDSVCRDVGGQPLKATAWPGVGGHHVSCSGGWAVIPQGGRRQAAKWRVCQTEKDAMRGNRSESCR